MKQYTCVGLHLHAGIFEIRSTCRVPEKEIRHFSASHIRHFQPATERVSAVPQISTNRNDIWTKKTNHQMEILQY